jgi:tRNA-splicing ligase RtcB
MSRNYEVLRGKGYLVKAWTKGVEFDENSRQQVINIAKMPFIHRHIAIMPDVHWGMGATIGSVIPTVNAIIPAAVGVDIGCGMMAVRTSLKAHDLPDNLHSLRIAIEQAVPHGRTSGGQKNDRGAWNDIPQIVMNEWAFGLDKEFSDIITKHPVIAKSNSIKHLGTLGTGNHFIEICLDEVGDVWIMLHSGSRGVGNKIGTYFINKAKEEMEKWHIGLSDKNLAYLPRDTKMFDDYFQAMMWAQEFAKTNREIMMYNVIRVLNNNVKNFELTAEIINCHHNYVSIENHFGKNVYLTRKGAVRAREGDMGIIPGSMGDRSFIVRGKGNKESFCSCSHGAGRIMSRTAAKAKFTIEDHKHDTAGVECRKDVDVIDETPRAYKPIDKVMAAQSDNVEIVHTLKQVLCVKG